MIQQTMEYYLSYLLRNIKTHYNKHPIHISNISNNSVTHLHSQLIVDLLKYFSSQKITHSKINNI